MKKILSLVITIMLMLTCVGCTSDVPEEYKEYLDGRFYTAATGDHDGNQLRIVVDKETKVMYLQYYYGFTVMLDADGKPLLWEG